MRVCVCVVMFLYILSPGMGVLVGRDGREGQCSGCINEETCQVFHSVLKLYLALTHASPGVSCRCQPGHLFFATPIFDAGAEFSSDVRWRRCGTALRRPPATLPLRARTCQPRAHDATNGSPARVIWSYAIISNTYAGVLPTQTTCAAPLAHVEAARAVMQSSSPHA